MRREICLGTTLFRPMVLIVDETGEVVRSSETCSSLTYEHIVAARAGALASLRAGERSLEEPHRDGAVIWRFGTLAGHNGRVHAVATGVDHGERNTFLREFSAAAPLKSPFPMWAFDRATCALVEANEAALRAYGYSAEELADRSVLDLCAPEPLDELLDALVTITDVPMWAGPWTQRRKDGTTFEADLCLISMETEGRPEAIALVHARAPEGARA